MISRYVYIQCLYMYENKYDAFVSGVIIIRGGKCPDNKVHGANMGPIRGRQEPGGPMSAPWT